MESYELNGVFINNTLLFLYLVMIYHFDSF